MREAFDELREISRIQALKIATLEGEMTTHRSTPQTEDMMKLGKPTNFNGDETKFSEWDTKFRAWMGSNDKGIASDLVKAKMSEVEVAEADMNAFQAQRTHKVLLCPSDAVRGERAEDRQECGGQRVRGL